MSTTIDISVDRTSLIATLSLSGANDKLRNDLQIICGNLSDSTKSRYDIISLPWFELRRGFMAVAQAIKREAATVQMDTFTQQLIQDIVNDKKSVRGRVSSIGMDATRLEMVLQQAGFIRRLKNHQQEDVLKLLQLKHGANFSVPGAGKTATILAVHTILKQLGLVSKLFVISPINAFISWEDEIKEIFAQHTPSILRLRQHHLQNKYALQLENPDIVLVNYEKLRRDISSLAHFFIDHNVHLILDESHRVKSGSNNMSYNQIIKLADLAKRRDILSGTPMPQSYRDLWPQFDFLWPGERIIPELTQQNNTGFVVENINKAIEGLYVRTTKNKLELDEPDIKYTYLAMGPIQNELYQLFKSETARILAKMTRPDIVQFRKVGSSIVKLLQAASNPMLLTTKNEYDEEILPIPLGREFWQLLDDFQKYEKPAKFEYLRKRVKEIMAENNDNKIVIWSYFVRNILILEKLFLEYNPVSIYGAILSGSEEDEDSREHRIREFHENATCRIMIANPQACGEGISLHKVCHFAIYLDRNFNAAYFLQSIDRIHRLGLKEGVSTKVEILISQNSVDETLIARLNDKISLMGKILEDPYLESLAYDPSDITVENETGIDTQDIAAVKQHVKDK